MTTTLQRENERLIAIHFPPEDLIAANEVLIRSLNQDGSPFESKNPNTRKVASVLFRTAQLQSVGNWFDEQAAKRLDVLEKELLTLLRMDDPTDDDEATLQRLFASAASRIKYAYADIEAETKAELEKLAKVLKPINGKPVDVAKVSVLGLTLAEHFKAQADAMALKFKAAVRAGLQAKDTLDGLIERVIGTAEAANVFCPTGEGGGVDPTCGKDFESSSSISAEGHALIEKTDGDWYQGVTAEHEARISKAFTSRLDRIKQEVAETGNVINRAKEVKMRGAIHTTDQEAEDEVSTRYSEHLDKMREIESELNNKTIDGLTYHFKVKPSGSTVYSESVYVSGWVEDEKEDLLFEFSDKRFSTHSSRANCNNEITDDHFINAAVTASGLVVRVRLVDAAQNSFGKMIQSAIQTVSNLIDNGAFDDVEDKTATGWEWNALHDGHVICPECEMLDGQRWDSEFNPLDGGPEWPGFGQIHFGCLCSQIPVDLEGGKVEKTSLDGVFLSQDRPALEASFGKANTEAFLDGRINGRQLLQQNDFVLSPEDLADVRANWKGPL